MPACLAGIVLAAIYFSSKKRMPSDAATALQYSRPTAIPPRIFVPPHGAVTVVAICCLRWLCPRSTPVRFVTIFNPHFASAVGK